MPWILVTAPLMLLALVVAVLPVLVMSMREARDGFGATPPAATMLVRGCEPAVVADPCETASERLAA